MLTVAWVDDLHSSHHGELQDRQHGLRENHLEGLRVLVFLVAQDPHSPRGPGLAGVELHLFLGLALEVTVFSCGPIPCADACRDKYKSFGLE